MSAVVGLPPNVAKALSDKLYEKRKNAALDIQRLVKDRASQKDDAAIQKTLEVLQDDFAFSTNPNSRKGGLIGLAAIAIALGQHHDSILKYLPELAPPVLGCFADPDARVRYYACEALYNISKVARLDILSFFNRIFVGLYKLASDSNPSVKNGAEMLDRLVKDIVNEECTALDLETFIPLLQERIYTVDPHSRQFLLSWMTVLESMPDLNIIAYLPTFLEGLFRMLSDQTLEIRRMCESLLGQFLRKIKAEKCVNFSGTIRTVLKFCVVENQLSKFMAISWLHAYSCFAGAEMLPYMSEIVGAVLPATSFSVDSKLRELAVAANCNLMTLIQATPHDQLVIPQQHQQQQQQQQHQQQPPQPQQQQQQQKQQQQQQDDAAKSDSDETKTREVDGKVEQDIDDNDCTDETSNTTSPTEDHPNTSTLRTTAQGLAYVESRDFNFNFAAMVVVLTLQLLHESVATRMLALKYFNLLHEKLPYEVFNHVDEFLLALLKTLSDPSDKVVSYDLKVMSVLSTCASDDPDLQQLADSFFEKIMIDILDLFSTDRELFEQRGSFVIRQFALHVDIEKIFRALAGIIAQQDDLEFANLMVQMLNLILLTAPEFFDFRQELKLMATPESRSLFITLYKSWCHSPVSTYALCLLSQNYEHCCELLHKFSQLEMTVAFLVEVDKLIQLIESPVFTYLRLQLLEPQRYAYLVKALYGLLMLLPQSAAYNMLKNRLDCVPTLVSSLELLNKESPEGQAIFRSSSIDSEDLLRHFDDIQTLHSKALLAGHTKRIIETALDEME